mmetsp:Transcript_30462/g.71175  ORF Transcript_30462/g.71175 Transcript_30462/m.71175 type:complete len:235 (+) Transcript_30462:1-705(+)
MQRMKVEKPIKTGATAPAAHRNDSGESARRDRSPRSCLRTGHDALPTKRCRVRFSAKPAQQVSVPSSALCGPVNRLPPPTKGNDCLNTLCSLMSEDEALRFRGHLRRHELRGGRAAVLKQDVGKSVYFVGEGELQSAGRGPNGKAYRICAGSCFGQDNFVDSLPPPGVPQVLVDLGKILMPFTEQRERGEDIVALTKTVLWELKSEDVEGLCGGNHEAMEYLRGLSGRRVAREE